VLALIQDQLREMAEKDDSFSVREAARVALSKLAQSAQSDERTNKQTKAQAKHAEEEDKEEEEEEEEEEEKGEGQTVRPAEAEAKQHVLGHQITEDAAAGSAVLIAAGTAGKTTLPHRFRKENLLLWFAGWLVLIIAVLAISVFSRSGPPRVSGTVPTESAVKPQLTSAATSHSTPTVMPNSQQQPPAASRNQAAIVDKVINIGKRMLSNLDKTRNTGPGFDYWPKGGIQIAYDHLATFGSYETLVKLSPYPIFLSGPHSARQLVLDERFTFGHYNPEFLRWFQVHLMEILRDRAFIGSTSKLFEGYLHATAMTYWETYTVLKEHPKELNTLLEDYKTRISNRLLSAL